MRPGASFNSGRHPLALYVNKETSAEKASNKESSTSGTRPSFPNTALLDNFQGLQGPRGDRHSGESSKSGKLVEGNK